MNIFGERMQELRKDLKITQDDLATTLNVSKNAISSWERGIREPNTAMQKQIADILNTTVSYLIGETNIPTKKNINLLEGLDDAQCFFRFDTSELNENERNDFEKQLEAYAKFLTGDIKNKRGE